MLKSVFVGRENVFNLVLANWLAHHTHLDGVVWADAGRYSSNWRSKWLKRSIKRDGVPTTIDRMLFSFFFGRSEERKAGTKRMNQDVRAAFPYESARDKTQQLWADSMRTKEVERFLKDINPDLIFVNCISQLIPRRVCELPRLGLFIYHEGVTPEYKGMHCPLWAISNGDNDKVGYTLLKADQSFDGGPVAVQGVTSLDPLATSLGYTGHWSLAEGFPQIAEFLQNLEAGTEEYLDTNGRVPGYYSYFGYSRYRDIKRRRKARGLTVGVDDVVFRKESPLHSNSVLHAS